MSRRRLSPFLNLSNIEHLSFFDSGKVATCTDFATLEVTA